MKVGVALYGLGTVGGGMVEVLAARGDELRARYGLSLRLCHVVVRDTGRERDVAVDRARLTRDWQAPLRDEGVDVVVEVMGGLEPAGTIVREALLAGRGVVTANKALIAARGDELERLARAHGGTLRYEAAVGGAIPVLGALRAGLAGNRIARVRGILNGTCNYILTRMADDRLLLADALARAQALGFAEADPSADLSGIDAAQKLVILARHAFGRWVTVDDVAVHGIDGLTLADLDGAERAGYRLKLVAEAVQEPDGRVRLRVGPERVAPDDPLATARDEMNAVLLEGDFAGPLLFTGRGAGRRATASAVAGDLVEVARRVGRRSLEVRG